LYIYFKHDSIGWIHAQCHPPLETSKIKIVKEQSHYLSAFKFEKYDTIVSIGAGMMWREAQFSVLTDSLVFYIEDIDTLCANTRVMQRVQTHYEKIKGIAFTNQFFPVTGTEKGVPILRDSIAHKVLMLNAFHHFTFPDEMLRDAYRLLKRGGKLCISEHCSQKTGDILRKVCSERHRFKSETDFIQMVENQDFTLGLVERTSQTHRIFVFVKP
jgi:hypothetical protein